jgi:hypothetical protein
MSSAQSFQVYSAQLFQMYSAQLFQMYSAQLFQMYSACSSPSSPHVFQLPLPNVHLPAL